MTPPGKVFSVLKEGKASCDISERSGNPGESSVARNIGTIYESQRGNPAGDSEVLRVLYSTYLLKYSAVFS